MNEKMPDNGVRKSVQRPRPDRKTGPVDGQGARNRDKPDIRNPDGDFEAPQIELETRVKERNAVPVETVRELSLKAALLDMVMDAVILRDMDQNIVYANEAATRLYGYTREELTGLNFSALSIPERRALYEENIKKVLTLGKLHTEVPHRRKDGTAVPVETYSHLITIDRQRFILSVLRDISERHRAEEALRLSEERYRLVVENASEAIVVTQDGKLKFFNPRSMAVTGYSAGELASMPFLDLVHPEDRELVAERYRRRLMGEAVPSIYEFRVVRKDGKIRWAQINAALITWEGRPATLNFLTDITEHKLAEDKIRMEELQFEKLFNAMSEGVALIAPDGHILKTNPAEKRIIGEKTRKTGRRYFRSDKIKHIHPDGRELPLEEMAVSLALKRKRAVRNMETGNINPDGTVRWFNINAVPVLDKSGNVSFVVRTISDITEQKRLRDERAQFTRKLIEVQEEERKRISRDLHDETAQYLALLTLEIDSLTGKLSSKFPEVAAGLQKLKGTAVQALKEVRRYSHELRPSVLEHFGLREALKVIINEFNERGNVEVKFSVTGREFRLSEDIELVLFRIAQEALNNVRKHSQATKANVRLRFDPREIRLAITDNGRGFVVSQQRAGSLGGLGIVGMRERASLIGASINIHSILGRGTTISVEVPLPGPSTQETG